MLKTTTLLGIATVWLAASSAHAETLTFPAQPDFRAYSTIPGQPAPNPDKPGQPPNPDDPGQPKDGQFPKLPPGLPSLPPGSKWQEIASTDAAAICSEGAAYAYFIREGDPDKLVINFTGGGACGDAASCDTSQGPTFFKDLGITRLLIDGGYGLGVFGAEHADNPINGWTHFVIPNCTGDLNLGDAQVTYTRADGTSFKTNHKGAPNTRAALAWLSERYKKTGKQPKEIVVVGSSAGAYAAIVWTAAVKRAFPLASVRHFSDCGAGVGDDAGAFPAVWNPTASYPAWIPGLNPAKDDVKSLGINDIYKLEAAYYPSVQFSQFNYNRDGIQSYFLKAAGGDENLWTLGLYSKMHDLVSNVPNFHSFIAEGTKHAILVIPDLYTLETNGVKFNSWLTDFINGKEVQNVSAWPFSDTSGQ